MTTALSALFSPDSPSPPDGGGSSKVYFFNGEGIPPSAWLSHTNGGQDCDAPFLWVRVTRRYKSAAFPTPTVGPAPCGMPTVIAVEMGVGRCANIDEEPDLDALEDEAEIGLDDSFRLELAMCAALAAIEHDPECGDTTAADAVVPYGPEGGIVAWITTGFVQI